MLVYLNKDMAVHGYPNPWLSTINRLIRRLIPSIKRYGCCPRSLFSCKSLASRQANLFCVEAGMTKNAFISKGVRLLKVDTLDNIPENAVVLDIRSPEEEDENPLEIDAVEVQHLPFYKLATHFGDLDKNKDYLLYCDQGIMSKLQALYLLGAGFTNVKVYRP